MNAHETTKTLSMILIAAIAVISATAASGIHLALSHDSVSGQPLPIREGPLGLTSTTSADPQSCVVGMNCYWFQQGVIGDSSTYSSVGASVRIRTVYDNVNNDAHSYWVGSYLANGQGFVQVGYLNELSTTNQYYCCAWFYEYFPTRNSNSPPIIGPPGSAGPIGSWHTYSMNYNASFGVWSFYMDNQYLGSSPTSGQYYLGSGSGVASTGSHSVAALSEVAQTSVNTDVIGPAEFTNFQYETSINSWNAAPTGIAHVGYGDTPSSNAPPNLYSVAEIEGLPNDFLAGSHVPVPGPNQCGSPAGNNAPLWGTTIPPCLGGTASFTFVDLSGAKIIPTWISLNDSAGSTPIFYTDYQNYNGLTVPSPVGQWTISQVSWHTINVAKNQIVNTSMASQVFSTNVFSITLAVVGYLYSLPVNGATVIMYLPDSTNQTLKTDNNGEGFFTQLPPANFTFRISVPYGITSNQVHEIVGPGSLVSKVFSLPELLTIIVPPVLIAIVASVAVARKEHQRQAMMQAQATSVPVTAPIYCRSCGHPLAPSAHFCTSCGTPVGMMIQ